ncbi:hypothetical protein A2U01_0060184, partial [Trifolium medium]|nr:hypothetical protein [Trifolium medium]
EASQHVDMLVDKIVSGMEDEDCGDPQAGMEHQRSHPSSIVPEEDRPLNVVLQQHPGSPVSEHPLDVSGLWTSPLREGQGRSRERVGSPQSLKGDSVVSSTARAPRHRDRSQSCPPRAKGSVMSG